jgi:hypothetical protein
MHGMRSTTLVVHHLLSTVVGIGSKIDTMNAPIRNPYWRGMIPMAGLSILFLAITLAMYGLVWIDLAEPWIGLMGLIFTLFFSLIFVIVWLLGRIQVRRIKFFLTSDRPLVRWTYSSAEWEQIKDTLWQEERSDWKIQLGCMAALLSLAGLLTGLLLGAEDGFIQALGSGIIGLLVGSLAGGAIGAVVAGSNYWSSRQAHSWSEPGQIALGLNEIYANDNYFRGNGNSSYIQEVKIHPGNPTTLEIQLVFPPRPRMPSEEQWLILVPSQWVERVEEILPIIKNVKLTAVDQTTE